MLSSKIKLEDTHSFSKTFLSYLAQDENLSAFYNQFPTLANFEKQLKKKAFPSEKRQCLSRILTKQYEDFTIDSKVSDNILSLQKENTFTITTGHQLNIFSGPLYFIYKIVTTINIAKKLEQQYKDYKFIPVYWMASEDHDFEEINHFNLFGKKHTWETEQKGAVGRFEVSGIDKILKEISEKLPLFEEAYLQHKNLSLSTRCFVNELFGKDGLVIIDADDKDLKKEFTSVIKDDLANHTAYNIVNSTGKKLQSLGYETQVNPREINLFYLDDSYRERIIEENSTFNIQNQALNIEGILKLADEQPEKFSPNVILRPLYQETILPNLAYVGGPAEIVYWLQLKELFDHYNIDFPFLMPRNFALYINKATHSKMTKLGISETDLFLSEDSLKNMFLSKNTENTFDLSGETKEIEASFEKIKNKAITIDKSLEGVIGAEMHKSIKSIVEIEKRLKKAEEKKSETEINQLLALKTKLFPAGSLQERHDNFLNFYINDPDFINKVKNIFDPFDFSFYVLKDE